MKTLYRLFAFAIISLAISSSSFSQNVGISSTAITPDTDALLELRSTTKGLLVPRMTAVQRGLYTSAANGGSGLSATEKGMTIFNTNTNMYNYWDGTAWVVMATATSALSSTLDDAYDAGGAGTGKTITADAGSVDILGSGGLIVSGGIVGIGTTAPDALLELNTAGGGSSGNFLLKTVKNSGIAGDVVGIGFGVQGGAHVVKSGILHERETTNGVGKLHFVVSDAIDGNDVSLTESRMTIDKNGLVGIGTTTPNTTLDVESNVNYPAMLHRTGNAGPVGFEFHDNNANAQTGYLEFNHRDANSIGNGASFHLKSSEATMGVIIDGNGGYYAGSNLALRSNGSSFLTGGNVGIGLTAPLTDLHIYEDDADIARVYATGNTQGSGMFYAGQSTTYGGGFVYDGDGAPALVGGTDRITFFRRSNGTDMDVMSYAQNNSALRITDLAGTGTRALYAASNGDLTASGPTSGANGYWSRTGTTLSPTTTGDQVDMNAANIIDVNLIATKAESDYDKLRVYSSNNYTIGMHSAMTMGGLNDWAMTFTFNNDPDRGFLWRDVSDAQSDGAMALTTGGHLTVKTRVDIGTSNTSGANLYLANRMLDWDNTGYYVDPGGVNRMNEIMFDDGSVSDVSVHFNGDANTGLYQPGNNQIGMSINGTEAVRINASRNVGIGTTNPLSKLTVAGGIGRTAHNNGHLEGSYNNVGANSAQTNPIYTIGSSYNPNTTTLSNMYGIGYAHTNASYITDPGPDTWGMYVASDGDARIWLGAGAGGVSYFNAGNVGIGTTGPTQKLDVNGNLRLRGGIIDDDATQQGNSDDWIRLNGYIELKSNTDNYGIVLRDKDNGDYFGITQKNGWSYLSDSNTSSNYFIRGNGANAQVRGYLQVGGPTGTEAAYTSPWWRSRYTVGILDNDPNGQISNCNVGATGEISNLNVYINISHTWKGDLEVSVIHPDGTRDMVHQNTGGSGDNIVQWFNNRTVFNGKPAKGAWTLYVEDEAGGDVGNINEWIVSATTTSWTVGTGDIVAAGRLVAGGNKIVGDMAEYFTSANDLVPGQLVEVDPSQNADIRLSKKSFSSKVFGVVTTDPSIILNSPGAGFPIALEGRIPVFINSEGGTVKKGDYITSSSIPGVARKASHSGYCIGIAMEDQKNPSDLITVLLHRGWIDIQEHIQLNKNVSDAGRSSLSGINSTRVEYKKDFSDVNSYQIFITLTAINYPENVWISDTDNKGFTINVKDNTGSVSVNWNATGTAIQESNFTINSAEDEIRLEQTMEDIIAEAKENRSNLGENGSGPVLPYDVIIPDNSEDNETYSEAKERYAQELAALKRSGRTDLAEIEASMKEKLASYGK